MAEFFKPSIDAIVDSVIEQYYASSAPVSVSNKLNQYSIYLETQFIVIEASLTGWGLRRQPMAVRAAPRPPRALPRRRQPTRHANVSSCTRAPTLTLLFC